MATKKKAPTEEPEEVEVVHPVEVEELAKPEAIVPPAREPDPIPSIFMHNGQRHTGKLIEFVKAARFELADGLNTVVLVDADDIVG